MIRKPQPQSPKKRKSKAAVASSKKFPPHTITEITNTREFFLEDFGKTLFPLNTNKVLIEHGEPEIREYINRCLDENDKTHAFLPQRRVYAAKSGKYLRRTVKLDVVAEYYIYDVVYRNRRFFRKPHVGNRTHYGYRFEGGSLVTPTAAYRAFKGAISEYHAKFVNSIGVDVATYFNNIYHHDIVSWFLELGASSADAEGLGQLLREINSGRSVDCLPQGLYPTKMIGNDFLRFVDNYHDLKCEQLVRFLDDIYIFSDNEENLSDDFQLIQQLLGDKGLSVNPRKTHVNDATQVAIDKEIDQVKAKLLQRRRLMLIVGYDEDGEEIVKESLIKTPLTRQEIGYIDNLLEKPDLEEDDAELILTIMRGHASRVEKRLPDIIKLYPHLAKNVHSFAAGISDKESVAEMILTEAKRGNRLLEYQLFWFAAMLDDYLMGTSKAAALISVLFNHKSATTVTKAKVLEIADLRFGLPELRNEYLVSGQSDWLAWSSAVGSRSLKPASRNHKLKYFGNSSTMNHLIANILEKS